VESTLAILVNLWSCAERKVGFIRLKPNRTVRRELAR
jgi:hypothetical protein